MAVYRRNRPPPIQTENLTYINDDSDGLSRNKRSLSSNWRTALTFLLFAAVIALAAQYAATNPAKPVGHYNEPSINEIEIRTEIAPGVSLRLDLAKPDGPSNENVVTMGPHTVDVSFSHGCKMARVWVRLVGEALIFVPMGPSDTSKWAGTFSFPVEGTYRVEVLWTTGCDASGGSSSFTSPMKLTVKLNASYRTMLRKSMSSAPIFQEGVWLSSKKFKTEASSPSYIWHDPRLNAIEMTFINASSSLGESLVSKEANPIPDEFRELSNYELVCWVGSESAASIREAFLSLRPELFRNQRPFKFHYYNLTSFEKPDQHWDEERKKLFRKCRTILVSVEQVDSPPLTQADYKRQVKTFLYHLLKAFNDDTFPIWMVTVNEPPMASTMCSFPLVSSGHHPCNDALFELWKEDMFPSRVKLLDTTDLVDPQFGDNQKDIIAVIAMRIYLVVGHQVAEWRRSNQIGKVNGLQRNGKVEPNPEEVTYDWYTTDVR